MPKRIKHEKRPTDVNQLAHYLGSASTQEETASVNAPQGFPEQLATYMAEIGRKGGKIGGKRRLVTMTSKKRKAVARKAAKVRWSGNSTKK
jgi:hypothetical protein